MELGSSPRGEPRRVPPNDATQLHRGFHRVGAAGHGELAVAEGFLAGGADGERVEDGAAGVLEDDRFGAGVDVSVAPTSLSAKRMGEGLARRQSAGIRGVADAASRSPATTDHSHCP
ncbi:MAG: hypothetical protein QOF88_3107 [Mycobacterium sp.]|jgi:hypothetical protein|nr:hypothetical protein [Mycobacterium sp.]